MKIYIVTTIHKGFEYNELYGSLIPEVFKEHTDALDFCKDECEAMGHGIILDERSHYKFILEEDGWVKEHCNINKRELLDNEYAYYIAMREMNLNSQIIDM